MPIRWAAKLVETGGPRRYPGNGIGLAIVYKAVERLGEQFGVESAIGQQAAARLNCEKLQPQLHKIIANQRRS